MGGSKQQSKEHVLSNSGNLFSKVESPLPHVINPSVVGRHADRIFSWI